MQQEIFSFLRTHFPDKEFDENEETLEMQLEESINLLQHELITGILSIDISDANVQISGILTNLDTREAKREFSYELIVETRTFERLQEAASLLQQALQLKKSRLL